MNPESSDAGTKLESYRLDTAPPFAAGAEGLIAERADIVVVRSGFTGFSAALAGASDLLRREAGPHLEMSATDIRFKVWSASLQGGLLQKASAYVHVSKFGGGLALGMQNTAVANESEISSSNADGSPA